MASIWRKCRSPRSSAWRLVGYWLQHATPPPHPRPGSRRTPFDRHGIPFSCRGRSEAVTAMPGFRLSNATARSHIPVQTPFFQGDGGGFIGRELGPDRAVRQAQCLVARPRRAARRNGDHLTRFRAAGQQLEPSALNSTTCRTVQQDGQRLRQVPARDRGWHGRHGPDARSAGLPPGRLRRCSPRLRASSPTEISPA